MENYEQESAENLPEAPLKKEFLSESAFPSPDNPPWNSPIALMVWLASVLFIVIVPSLFFFPYLWSQGVDFSDKAGMQEIMQGNSNAILINLIAIVPAHLLTLAFAWLVVTRYNKFSFRETLGWRWGGFTWWNCLIILGGFFVVAAVIGHYVPEQENDLLRILKSSRTAVYIVAFLAVFTAPIVEEVVYRGVLYSAFQRSVGVPAAVLLTTFLFAIVHVPQYFPSYSTIFLICLLSLILTLVRVRTGNLLPCIALHTVFNGIQSLILIAAPYLEEASQQPQSPAANIFPF